MQKIYWYGFKRQAIELHYFLLNLGLIRCDIITFLSHFTGKKFGIENDYSEKITWYGGKELLKILMQFLSSKRFLQGDESKMKSIYIHFRTSKSGAPILPKKFQSNLEMLFPAESGYRCKERLFYRSRNKTSFKSVMESLKVT